MTDYRTEGGKAIDGRGGGREVSLRCGMARIGRMGHEGWGLGPDGLG